MKRRLTLFIWLIFLCACGESGKSTLGSPESFNAGGTGLSLREVLDQMSSIVSAISSAVPQKDDPQSQHKLKSVTLLLNHINTTFNQARKGESSPEILKADFYQLINREQLSFLKLYTGEIHYVEFFQLVPMFVYLRGFIAKNGQVYFLTSYNKDKFFLNIFSKDSKNSYIEDVLTLNNRSNSCIIFKNEANCDDLKRYNPEEIPLALFSIRNSDFEPDSYNTHYSEIREFYEN